MPADAFARWETFYVILGSSAAAMTGLMFVAVTLLGEGRRRGEALTLGMSAFNTPTVLHFCSALLISLVVCVPWTALRAPGLTLSLIGLAGIVYSLLVILRMRRIDRRRDYSVVASDWIGHGLLPMVAYVTLFLAGFVLPNAPSGTELVIGAVTALLLFTGVRNAWDIVTYLTMEKLSEDRKGRKPL